jgi:type VI secretion system protein ImpG
VNKRLLFHYNNELVHLRQSAAEFAREYPKVAGRLALDPDGKDVCQDPFVERLLEGFAFLTARIQHKFEADFPRLTEALLETVYPDYLAPLPSLLVAAFEPDLHDGGLAEGYTVPRHSVVRGNLGPGQTTACEYRLAHPVTLWPLQVTEASYVTRDFDTLGLAERHRAKAAIRIRLQVTAGLAARQLKLDELVFYLRGPGEVPYRILEQILAQTSGIFVQAGTGRLRQNHALSVECIQTVGFEEEEALLPPSPRTFSGYRHLREYFAFPERYLFFRLTGLAEALAGVAGDRFDLVLTLNDAENRLENQIDAETFALFCAPAANLFPKRLDRVSLSSKASEYHLVADKSRPLDYEVYQVQTVTGVGGSPEDDQKFTPFYFQMDRDLDARAYFTTHRRPRLRSARERLKADVSKYAGSEVFLSVVDGNQTPWNPEISQLAVTALCTNRHLPIQMPTGRIGGRGELQSVGRSDLYTELGGPIRSVTCLSGPTEPRPAAAAGDREHLGGDLAWRIISHLSLNYLSLLDQPPEHGAAALREILKLYTMEADAHLNRQIQGLLSVRAEPIIRRISTSGSIAFGRGLEVELLFREAEFVGSGVFLLGAVLNRFIAKYASINSFTETVVKTSERGEIMRWKARPGTRGIL